MYRQRSRNLYDPNSPTPFPISRSKIDMFLDCPRCFYLDRRLGFGRPSMPGFSLNSAVDQLFKNDFDFYRERKEPHSLMLEYNIDAIPLKHPDLSVWRDDMHRWIGASFLHQPTNLEIRGIVDDIWVTPAGELIIIDYKSTSTNKEISLDDEYKQGYKKQLEIYQWIFKQLGFQVSDKSYIVYANGIKNEEKMFDARLDFKLSLHEHIGDTSWIEPTIFDIKKCLDSEKIPPAGAECEYCAYRRLVSNGIKSQRKSFGHLDELYGEAMALFRSRNRVNPVLLQRTFHIGFNKAQLIIDQGIEQGVIDPETKELLK